MAAAKDGEAPDMDAIPLDDEAVYTMLTAGDTDGVFQLESAGMKALERDLKPSTFEDINALVALFRPGPLNSGMAKSFVDRKHGREKIEVAHPDIAPVLESTYGTIVYQEQIMQVAQILAGYSLGRADLLRRAMGKKKAEVMEKEREGFVEGCISNGVDDKIANSLFDTMSEFAAYCFNRSHSAAYAFVAYQTAWLKVHYPVEYMSALLSSVRNDLDKIQFYILASRRMGIQILPPDVRSSGSQFTPDYSLKNEETGEHQQALRFGLASIKNVGSGVVEEIINARNEKLFEDLDDFFKRAGHAVNNSKTLESLIHAGALDGFGVSRKQLSYNLDELLNFSQQHKQRQETGQNSLFDMLAPAVDNDDDTPNFAGILLSGDTDEYPDEELQTLEKALLGFYVSSHPLDSLTETLHLIVNQSVAELKDMKDQAPVRIGGLLGMVQSRQTRTGKAMLLGQLEDFSGTVEIVAFGKTAEGLMDTFIDGKGVLITGKVSYRGDDSFSIIADTVTPIAAVEPVTLELMKPPTYEELDLLRQMLQEHRGEQPVVMEFPDGTKMKVGQAFWVNNNDGLKSDLDATLVQLR